MYAFKFGLVAFVAIVGACKGSVVYAQPSFLEALMALASAKDHERFTFQYTLFEEKYRNDAKEIITAIHEEGSIAAIPGKGLWLTRRGQHVLERNRAAANTAEEKEAVRSQQSEKKEDYLWTYSLCQNDKVSTTNQSTDFITVTQLTTPSKYPAVPFDFRLLGIGSYGDINSGRSLEDVLKFWESVGSKMPAGVDDTLRSEPVVSYDGGTFKFMVDFNKGSSFCYQQHLGSRKVLGRREPFIESETEVKVELKNDRWVPIYAKVKSRHGTMEIYITWTDPKNVSDAMFTLDNVRTLMQADKESMKQFQSEK